MTIILKVAFGCFVMFSVFCIREIYEGYLIVPKNIRFTVFKIIGWIVLLLRRILVRLLRCIDGGVADVTHLKDGYILLDVPYYTEDFNKHRLILKLKKRIGPRPIVDVWSESGDLSNSKKRYVFQCLGISSNFHSIPTTPEMLGINEKIFVKYNNGEIRGYSFCEPISTTIPCPLI